MIFNAFQRDDDDAVYTIVRNVSGASRAVGQAVVWDISSSVDGVRVTVPATATRTLFRGILAETIADSAYGKCQIHGYCSYASVINDTSYTHTAGHALTVVNGQTYLATTNLADNTVDGLVYAAEAFAINATPAAAAKKVLIRAM